jgi:TolB-like protein/tetratricopeptide (TPR) repeat protein
VAGRYRIGEEIGRGGAACVFRAHDLAHQRAVAIKVLRPDLILSSERFLREILTLARLQHPHIVPLFDSGQAAGLLYFVMPLVEGMSLRQRLATGPVAVAETVSIALEVADALAYAHARGLVHRDIKPENILLSEGHAIVTDFGIARAIEQSVGAGTTGTGIAIGTVSYMSPEQASAADVIDGRSDQYALACVLYEMLSGRPPFTGSSPQAVLAQRMHGEVASLRTRQPDLPESLDAAIRRALALAPADRFATIGAFADALLPVAAAITARTPSGSVRARLARWTGRRVPARRAGLAAVILALGSVAVLAFLLLRPKPGDDTRAWLAALDPRRIAVLYFDDHSPDRSLGYLASGLTESLIHELTSVPAIQVISRNGVKPFRDASVQLDSIFAALRVGSLVEGSVQRSADRVRVTVQLIEARTGTHLESATFERPMGELFLLEDDLAREVSSLLRRRIGLTVRVRETIAGTTSARARELMFRADQARDAAESAMAVPDTVERVRGIGLLRTADSLLDAAEQADRRWNAPVLTRGWVALEIALRQSGEPRARAFDQAMRHAERALAREPGSAAALELQGTVLHFQAARLPVEDATWSALLQRAQASLERAVAIDTSLATAWATLSRVRILRGEVLAAERNATTALAMDAYLKDAPNILVSLYAATLMGGSLPASWRWCERGAREYPRDPRFVECRLTLLAEDLDRRPDVALAWALAAEGNRLDPPGQARAIGRPYLPYYREMLAAIVSARAGDRDSARAVAARLGAAVAGDAELSVDLKYETAYLHLVLGEPAQAVQLLSEYIAARPSRRNLVGRHPRWHALRTDPDFIALVGTTTARGT